MNADEFFKKYDAELESGMPVVMVTVFAALFVGATISLGIWFAVAIISAFSLAAVFFLFSIVIGKVINYFRRTYERSTER